MSEFHITGDDVYYEGHLVARLLPMTTTVRADVVYELEALPREFETEDDEDGERLRALKAKLKK